MLIDKTSRQVSCQDCDRQMGEVGLIHLSLAPNVYLCYNCIRLLIAKLSTLVGPT